MPFSRSRSIESITRSLTEPSSAWCVVNAPDCQSMESTNVVLPWSTWAMMAMLRRSVRWRMATGGSLLVRSRGTPPEHPGHTRDANHPTNPGPSPAICSSGEPWPGTPGGYCRGWPQARAKYSRSQKRKYAQAGTRSAYG